MRPSHSVYKLLSAKQNINKNAQHEKPNIEEETQARFSHQVP